MARVKARFFNIVEENMEKTIDELKDALEKESKHRETMRLLENDIQLCLEKRKSIDSHIQIKDMKAGSQFNKLKTESRLFMNVLRMIAFRAETAVVNLLEGYYSKVKDEGLRAPV